MIHRLYPFTYLASPYTHPEHSVRERRFKAACLAAATLMRQGKRVFCPIAHSHPIDLMYDAPESGDFWKEQDAPYLWACSEMVILMLVGWQDSQGIKHERAVAEQRGIRVRYMDETGAIT